MKQLLKKMIGYGLKNVCFHLIPPQKNQVIPYEEANQILNNRSPDPNTSPLRMNAVHKKEYDLTVIVPVYNAEKYLEQCVSSILSQKTQYRYQVIVVNDGSTDHSSEILSAFSKNEHLLIINQKNQGFSGARNTGLQEVRGEFIMFVDSDDFLPENAIESLMSTAGRLNADIVQGGYVNISEDSRKQWGAVRYADASDVPPNGVIAGMAWGKVYKSELFSEVCFPEGYWYEDTIITGIVTHLASRIATTSDIVYYYRSNPSGITQSSKKRPKSIDTYYVLRSVLTARKQLSMCTDQAFYEHLLRLVPLCYQRTKNEPERVQRSIFSLIQKMLEEERGIRGFDVHPKYKKLEKMILDGDFRRYCLLCSVLSG